MSGSEVQLVFAVWVVGGALVGLLAWRLSPQSEDTVKNFIAKIGGGIIGALMFGWISLALIPQGKWQWIGAHAVAAVMGFVTARWGSGSERRCGLEPYRERVDEVIGEEFDRRGITVRQLPDKQQEALREVARRLAGELESATRRRAE